MRKKLICVDFDGVLHLYTSGWQGADVVSDPPTPQAITWLAALVADGRFEVAISSSRSSQDGGIDAMQNWLLEHGLPENVLAKIAFPTIKPPAHLTIDDRAWRFTGKFPLPEEMFGFYPWNHPRRNGA